ncbi:NADP-dependent oxidoreductase domain-containing protein [Podospora conica]|nr:NADP-dependent oxidoreductase domain-containing protein [Schizothecium conicum]
MPPIIYGTAWKKERTAELTFLAIKHGFRAIDTAAMKLHYHEAGVGQAINRALKLGIVTRKDLWIQTKYTPNDEPYASDPSTPTIASQIQASVASSLRNLFPDPTLPDSDRYLDALILHAPYPNHHHTLQAWDAFLPLVPHTTRCLGVSNAPLQILRLLTASPIPPAIVQNRVRTLPRERDVDVRRFCRASGIRYQGFWTLTANDEWKTAPAVTEVARRAGVASAVVWYALLGEVAGVTVLNGTSRENRMKADLEGLEVLGPWKETEEGRGPWGEAVAWAVGLMGV